MTMLADSLTPPVEIDWNDPVEVDWDFAQEIGAVAWYPGWPIGGNTLFDLIGQNHGALVSAEWTFGPNGTGTAILGSTGNRYVNLGTSISLSSYTIHGWCSLASISDYRFLFGDPAQNSKLGINSGSLTSLFVRVQDGGTGQTPTVPAISLNEWHGFGLSKDGSVSATAYRFGIPTALSAGSGSATFGRLGGEGQPTTWSWYGSYCDMLICNKANSTSHIEELAAKPFRLAWQPSRRAIFDIRASAASGSGGGKVMQRRNRVRTLLRM